MVTFTFGDPQALKYALAIPPHKYPMELNPHDLETVLTALLALSERDETDIGENAGLLYSGILETLGIEVI